MISAVCILACDNPQSSSSIPTVTTYFDTHTFFQQEIKRLKSENPSVNKTVQKENQTESKVLNIKNWENELSSFTTIDLRKPAYVAQFDVNQTPTQLEYKAINDKLDIRSVNILLDNQQRAQQIIIIKQTDNTLYHTLEKLTYNKNEGYSVEKEQKIRLLGTNKYVIKSYFNL